LVEAYLPGDLVQVDTLELRPLPGVVLKHFTARDVICRWDVVEVHRRATASAATRFLDTLQQRMPFLLRALQVDGGSEFAAAFEEACQQRGLKLFVLPPRSPKLNGCVERAQRTHREEFYEVTECSLEIAALNQELQAWEQVYNLPAAGRHRASAPSPGLPHSPRVPGPVAIPIKGGQVSLIYWTSTHPGTPL
jgi:transposase InsO family protein